MSLIVDTREPQKIKKQMLELCAKNKINCILEKLDVGDFQYGEVIIERKEIKDFVASFPRDSFWENLRLMKENYEHPFLIISGTIDDVIETLLNRRNGLQLYRGIQGTINSISLKFFPVIIARDDKQILEIIIDICKKTGRVGDRPGKKINKSKDVKLIREDVLTCVPGIGMKKAKHLISEYGSIDIILTTILNEEIVISKKITDSLASVFLG